MEGVREKFASEMARAKEELDDVAARVGRLGRLAAAPNVSDEELARLASSCVVALVRPLSSLQNAVSAIQPSGSDCRKGG